MMLFAKRLRQGIARGRIRCTVRIWTNLRVRVGGRYPMEGGHVVVDSIERIRLRDITPDLAGESGFESAADLLRVARHGKGRNVYLIRFHYLRPGAWDTPPEPPSQSMVRGAVRGRRRGARAATS